VKRNHRLDYFEAMEALCGHAIAAPRLWTLSLKTFQVRASKREDACAVDGPPA
jgi:hypothetical protein